MTGAPVPPRPQPSEVGWPFAPLGAAGCIVAPWRGDYLCGRMCEPDALRTGDNAKRFAACVTLCGGLMDDRA